MTLGTNSESALLAFNKRKAQLDRWSQSETERETAEIRNRPKRVKFADKCIFQAACASNDKAQVARMIRDGYNINAVDEDGITALHQVRVFTTKEFS
jgi:protein phosphatase 1 regulatory subunit 12B